MEIDKVNVSNNDEIKNISESTNKPGGSTLVGPSGSHGLKLSMNMTSRDKKAFLAKYEEWHKARKEKFTKKISLPNTSTTNRPSQSIKNKEIKISELKKVSSSEQKKGETVFERLYKNVKRPDRKTINTSAYTDSDVETVEANAKKLITPKASTRHHSLQSNCMKVNDSGVIPCGIEFNNLMANKQAGELSAKQEVNSADVLRAELQNKLVKTGTCNNLNEKELLNKEDSIVKENELPFVLVNEAVSENDHTTCLKTFQESTKDSYLETISEEISEKNSPNLKNDNLKSTDKSVLPKPNCPKVHNKGKIYCKTEKVGKPVRRSISMLYRKKMEIRRSTSEKNLNEMKLMSGEKKHHLQSQAFTFEDILGNKSKFANKSVSLFSPEKKVGATSNSLRNNLEDWLKSNGHSLFEYRHLRCFGISLNAKKLPDTLKKTAESHDMKSNTSDDEDNKENTAPPETEKKNHEEVDVLQGQNWLKELYRLIVELKYPNERCEEWLTAIKKRCPKCTQLPIYWECLAALNGSNGDMKSAIENYEKAIIKGAEVESIGDSLAELFDKMVIESQKSLGGKLEKGLNPSNIFKSTVIKFALQQKAVKESTKKTGLGTNQSQSGFVATPVRRSSRIRTPCKKDVVSSLQSLTPEVRKIVTFKTNESLLNAI